MFRLCTSEDLRPNALYMINDSESYRDHTCWEGLDIIIQKSQTI